MIPYEVSLEKSTVRNVKISNSHGWRAKSWIENLSQVSDQLKRYGSLLVIMV